MLAQLIKTARPLQQMIHSIPLCREIAGIVSGRISLRLHLLQYLDTVLRERVDLGRDVAQQANAVVPEVLDDFCWQFVISGVNRRANGHVCIDGIQAPILLTKAILRPSWCGK